MEQQDTFSSSPSTLARAIFEVLTLARESASVTMDVAGADPHTKEKKDVYMRVPSEFGEAATGYENVMRGLSKQGLAEDRLLLKLEANAHGRRPAAAKWRGEFETLTALHDNWFEIF